MKSIVIPALLAAVLLGGCGGPAWAQAGLRCGPFTSEAVAAPAPRIAAAPLERFEQIQAAVKTEPYRVLYLGDSITERFDPLMWRENMAPRGVLNSGVNGDRTENLLWRLQHGNLDGPAPAAFVMLIGTNDLTNGGHGRSPELTAEGIRANLLYLRQRFPSARILLLGLWPRSASPQARLRQGVNAVNRLIQRCGDNASVIYADLGGRLLEPDGRLSTTISPDLLHFSRAGYQRLMPQLDALIDRMLAGR
ncbi:MAG TPA: GDSL-type esterase/lipase family protein [Stellaceae bacterium]|jgi:beta-glucosidase|nr:GDSL-type esterase/lipase family protein [Stellaceae bacterium]